MLKAEVQMAENNMAEKEDFQHLAEYANGRILLGRIQSMWISTRAHSFQSTFSGFAQFHRVIVCLRRDYRAVMKNFNFSQEKLRFFMNLYFLGIFRNFGGICDFRPFDYSAGFFFGLKHLYHKF
jgi:hypothetical protein